MSKDFFHHVPYFKKLKLYKFLRYLLKYRISKIQLFLAKKWFKVNKYKFYDDNFVIYSIVHEKKSIIRFGDGEYSCLIGAMRNKGWAGSSQCDRFVRQELSGIIGIKNEKIIIGILPNPPGTLKSGRSFQNLNGIEYIYFKYYRKLRKYLSLETVYASSGIFLPHHNYVNQNNSKAFYDKFDIIWNNKKVIFVFSINGRFDPNHYVFRNVREKFYVNCDSINAHKNLDLIYKEITKHSEEYLVILSAGFLAKLIIPRLVDKGYQAVDVGHFTYNSD